MLKIICNLKEYDDVVMKFHDTTESASICEFVTNISEDFVNIQDLKMRDIKKIKRQAVRKCSCSVVYIHSTIYNQPGMKNETLSICDTFLVIGETINPVVLPHSNEVRAVYPKEYNEILR